MKVFGLRPLRKSAAKRQTIFAPIQRYQFEGKKTRNRSYRIFNSSHFCPVGSHVIRRLDLQFTVILKHLISNAILKTRWPPGKTAV